LDGLPSFYKDFLTFFNELKNLYSHDRVQDMVPYKNKEILVRGNPVFIRECFDGNILSVPDLLNSNGQLQSFQEFKNKCACKLQIACIYQVISAIPKHLVTKTRNTEPPENELYTGNNFLFQLDDSTQIQLEKAKTRDLWFIKP